MSQPLFSGYNAARVLGQRRVVRPETGEACVVTELDAHDLPGAPAATCLLFDGPTAVCRLWAYPREWVRLSDAALLALRDAP